MAYAIYVDDQAFGMTQILFRGDISPNLILLSRYLNH